MTPGKRGRKGKRRQIHVLVVEQERFTLLYKMDYARNKSSWLGNHPEYRSRTAQPFEVSTAEFAQ